MPRAPPVIAIQETLLTADQASVEEDGVTVTDPVPAAAPALAAEALNEAELAVPAWATATAAPATVTVPVRAAPVFEAAENVTVPAPLPDTPAVMARNAEPLAADHAQPAGAVT